MSGKGEPRQTVLEPVERLSEILFGLIMALTFTGSLSVATADRGEVRSMLIGALGCNIAWGLIDAIMYLMHCLNARGGDLQTLVDVRRARSRPAAHSAILSRLPPTVAAEINPEVLDRIRTRMEEMPISSTKPGLKAEDFRGAWQVFLIVVASTLPVSLPFLLVKDVALAMRLSNGVAVAMLALIGFAYGRASGLSPIRTALSMVLIGIVLVALTIALGG